MRDHWSHPKLASAVRRFGTMNFASSAEGLKTLNDLTLCTMEIVRRLLLRRLEQGEGEGSGSVVDSSPLSQSRQEAIAAFLEGKTSFKQRLEQPAAAISDSEVEPGAQEYQSGMGAISAAVQGNAHLQASDKEDDDWLGVEKGDGEEVELSVEGGVTESDDEYVLPVRSKS